MPKGAVAATVVTAANAKLAWRSRQPIHGDAKSSIGNSTSIVTEESAHDADARAFRGQGG